MKSVLQKVNYQSYGIRQLTSFLKVFLFIPVFKMYNESFFLVVLTKSNFLLQNELNSEAMTNIFAPRLLIYNSLYQKFVLFIHGLYTYVIDFPLLNFIQFSNMSGILDFE